MPEYKEPSFFVDERRQGHDREWYLNLFAAKQPHQIAGEASTSYTMFPRFTGAPTLMARALPDARLIYLTRDPIARMISAWRHALSTGMTRQPLAEAVLSQLIFVAPSLYGLQVEMFLEHFPRQRLLIGRLEDLWADPASFMRHIAYFLDIDPDGFSADFGIRHNDSAVRLAPRRLPALMMRNLENRAIFWRIRGSRLRSVAFRALDPGEADLSVEVRKRISRLVECDMKRLRTIVGPEFDLWGYA